MADRYWIIGENMGYAGTDSEDDVDVLNYLNITEIQLANMTNAEVEEELCKYAWEDAMQKVDVWATVNEDQDQ